MISREIQELEAQLARAREMVDRDEAAVRSSDRSLVEKVFLSSSSKLRAELEHSLMLAKAERAHELVRLRMHGTQLSTGSIQLRALIKIIPKLNSVLEKSAWRIWDKAGDVERIAEDFVRLMDLRLAGVERGSTELIVLGNTLPDLTGDSALEAGLKNVFALLSSSSGEFTESLHEVGVSACKDISELLTVLENEHIAVELEWTAPEKLYRWDGKPAEITRVRALLEEVGDPTVEALRFDGIVQVLSVRGRIEVYRVDTEEKLRITYHRSLAEKVKDLRLGDQRTFLVDKTEYPFTTTKRKRDAYQLVEIGGADRTEPAQA